jgi:hypothetical protein
VIGEKLDRDRVEEGRNERVATRHRDAEGKTVAEAGDGAASEIITTPLPRAITSSTLPSVFSNRSSVRRSAAPE